MFAALLSLALGALAPAFAADRARFVKADEVPLGKQVVELRVEDGERRIVAMGGPTNIFFEDIQSITYAGKVTDTGEAAYRPMILLGID